MPCDPSWLPAQPYADEDDLLCVTCEGVDFASDVWAWAVIYASRRVFDATGGKYPGCMRSKIRPCRRVCNTLTEFNRYRGLLNGEHMLPAIPYVVNDAPAPTLVNCWACACDSDPCHCTHRSVFSLPYRPVGEVTEVLIDGEVFTDWTLEGHRLYRTDGEPWPTCNDPEPDTEPGTWSITFSHGLGIPDDARPLVAAYACELAKRACHAECDLPDGVRVISRPGVEYAVLDTVYRDHRLTGYQPLDDWIILDLGGLHRAREHPRLWTSHRRENQQHRLVERHALATAAMTGDGIMRETLHLRNNEDRTKTVAYPGKVLEEGRLSVVDGDGNLVLDIPATIVDGVAYFEIEHDAWVHPGDAVIGRWDMIVKPVGGGWDVVAAGPVRFHDGVAEPV